MASYWLRYEWSKNGKNLGTNMVNFNASSDEEAKEKAQQFMRDFRENDPPPDIKYIYLQTLREV